MSEENKTEFYPKTKHKIIRRYQTPDTATGDFNYMTEDGRHWQRKYFEGEVTGQVTGHVVGGWMVEKR